MPDRGINGTGLAAIAAGSVFLYAGIRGKSVLSTVQTVISGRPPSAAAGANPITTPVEPTGSTGLRIGGGSPPGTTTGSQIANDALRYNGSPYVWGGHPGEHIGPTGIGDHDCSSLPTWVFAHDLGIDAPGIQAPWAGLEHGPTTTSYLIWGGGLHIPRSQCAAGDLVVGYSHMGIAISNTEYISAHDPASGTGVTNIDPFPDAVYSIIRVKAASAAVSPGYLLSHG